MKVTVPVDMNSEQKNILGILSSRQVLYIAIGAIVLYAYVPAAYKLGSGIGGFMFGLVTGGISALPVLILVLMLGFVPVSKFNMNRDLYYVIKIQSKLEKGSWRKGSYR